MKDGFEERSACRVCQSNELVKFLDLGEMPPSNGFVKDPSVDEMSYPLVVSVCDNCNHVQLAHTVDRQSLFSEYHYFSSSSSPLEEHFAEYAESVKRTHIDEDDFVVEIGSNDGILLKHFEEHDRLGIEPAENVATVARERDIPTLTEFFSLDLADKVKEEHGQAKVLMANNVVGHIDDLQSLMHGVNTLLTEDGTFVVEVPYFVDLYNGNEFDTIYHEHISYFSIHSFAEFANRHGMVISDVERKSVHGGTIRVHIQKANETTNRSSFVEDLLALERSMGLDDIEAYRSFAKEIREFREQIRTLLKELSSSDVTVVGYGAPAKGNVLLNYCDIGTDMIDFIIDTTPAKQGAYTPGTNIPVHPPEKFHEEQPEYALLLAWNYQEAILEKEAEYRKHGSFIVPIPHLDIV